MSERSERVRILTRITVIISISLLLVTAGSASCHDDRSPLISTLSPILPVSSVHPLSYPAQPFIHPTPIPFLSSLHSRSFTPRSALRVS